MLYEQLNSLKEGQHFNISVIDWKAHPCINIAEIEALYAKKEAKAAEAARKQEETEAAQKSAEAEEQQTAADGSNWDTSGLNENWGADADSMKTYCCPSCGAELN